MGISYIHTASPVMIYYRQKKYELRKVGLGKQIGPAEKKNTAVHAIRVTAQDKPFQAKDYGVRSE